jgi:hypothetical protein
MERGRYGRSQGEIFIKMRLGGQSIRKIKLKQSGTDAAIALPISDKKSEGAKLGSRETSRLLTD